MLAIAHLALMFALPIALAILAAAWLRRAMRRRAIAKARELAASADETMVSGRLVLLGEDGDELPGVAALTTAVTRARGRFDGIALRERKREARLAIVDGDGAIELVGPVEVAGASHIRCDDRARKDGERRAYGLALVLRSGDAVRACGKLGEVPDSRREAEGFRHKPIRRRLEPAGDDGAIRVAAIGAPHIAGESWLRRPAVLLAAIAPLWLPIGALSSYLQTSGSGIEGTCAESGGCHVLPNWRAEAWRGVLEGMARGDHFFAGATSDEDCRGSRDCKEYGHCTAIAGICRAGRDEDCHPTWGCFARGQCSPSASGSCAVVRDDDCTATPGCIAEGRCSAVDGKCLLAKDADCARLPNCPSSGECAARLTTVHDQHGHCDVSDDGCRRSADCFFRGDCAAAPNGMCMAGGGCDRTAGCASEGRCTLQGHRCDVGGDDDCRRSRACAEEGRCCSDGGKCAARKDCPIDECAARGKCGATSDADCASSVGCARDGWCAKVGDTCRATSEAMCQASDGCRALGRCSAEGGVCKALHESDCDHAEHCRRARACVLKAGRCIIDWATLCRRQPACKIAGLCSRDDTGNCSPGGDDDCKASEVCSRYGWCVRASIHDLRHARRWVTSVGCFARGELDNPDPYDEP